MTTPTPHDSLFKFTFGEPRHAASMLRRVLPQEVAEAIQWESLERLSVDFVDEEFSKLYADLLFAVKLRDREALLWLLFEHQSSPDPWMAFRLLEYCVRVWKDWLRTHEDASHLPAIVPVVLHHGKRGWRASTRFSDLLDLDDATKRALAPHLIDFRFVLDDLTHQTDDAIRARALTDLAELVALAFKHLPYDDDPLRALEAMAPLMARVKDHDGLAALSAFFRYTLQVANVEADSLRGLVAAKVGQGAEEVIMTAAERLIQQGHREGVREGRLEGRQEGRAEVLLKLSTIRFGDVPAEVADRIRKASSEELDAWIERILTASTADDVFAPRR